VKVKKCIGSVLVFVCLFTSCPQSVGFVKIRVNNNTSVLNVNEVILAYVDDTGAGSASRNLLNDTLLAGETKTLTVSMVNVGDANGIWVFMSGNRNYKAQIPGGYKAGITVVVDLDDAGQGGADMDVYVQ
jgi:hypothetical protein